MSDTPKPRTGTDELIDALGKAKAERDAAVARLNTAIEEGQRLRELWREAKERGGPFAKSIAGAELAECRKVLAYLADPENWVGNPHDQTSTLHGHFTPFELALAALSPEGRS